MSVRYFNTFFKEVPQRGNFSAYKILQQSDANWGVLLFNSILTATSWNLRAQNLENSSALHITLKYWVPREPILLSKLVTKLEGGHFNKFLRRFGNLLELGLRSAFLKISRLSWSSGVSNWRDAWGRGQGQGAPGASCPCSACYPFMGLPTPKLSEDPCLAVFVKVSLQRHN